MSVLYFSQGLTTHDDRFLRLIASRYETLFLRLQTDGREPKVPRVSELHWPQGFAENDVTATIEALQELIATHRPALIHAGPMPGPAFLAASTRFHPLISMSWGSDLLVTAQHDRDTAERSRFAVLHSDLFVCDSDAVRAAAQRLAGSLPRIVRFPWGTDVDRFTPLGDSARGTFGWDSNLRVVVSTRSWEPEYSPEVVLSAFIAAHAADRRLRLLWLGGGSMEPRLREMLSAAALGPEVVAPVGRVDEEHLPQFLRAADIYLSTAPNDGTSVSLLQALSTGLPVIVADAPGNREWIAPEKNGWLVPRDDSPAFASAIAAAARISVVDRQRMREANRAVALSRADWSSNSSRLLDAYAALLQPARPA